MSDPLSPRLLRSLEKFGHDMDVARKKRHLTIAALCERAGISPGLYRRMVAGAPGTAVGAYAMVLFALGLGMPFENLIDAGTDDTGLLLDEERLPQRVRMRKKPVTL